MEYKEIRLNIRLNPNIEKDLAIIKYLTRVGSIKDNASITRTALYEFINKDSNNIENKLENMKNDIIDEIQK